MIQCPRPAVQDPYPALPEIHVAAFLFLSCCMCLCVELDLRLYDFRCVLRVGLAEREDGPAIRELAGVLETWGQFPTLPWISCVTLEL